jgi:hypothetical protein
MTTRIDYTKRVHLWSDGTWDEQGGNWVAAPAWHWEMLNKLIDENGLRRELTKRMKKAVTE